jgi:septal ring factor EnvC (AmiA/AmiB activator)
MMLCKAAKVQTLHLPHCCTVLKQHQCSFDRPAGLGLARIAHKDGSAESTFYVFRNSIAEKEKHAAALQQQRDAAQADIDKAASQLQEAQQGRAILEQQLQQVSEQLSASQQAQRKVSWHHCC